MSSEIDIGVKCEGLVLGARCTQCIKYCQLMCSVLVVTIVIVGELPSGELLYAVLVVTIVIVGTLW